MVVVVGVVVVMVMVMVMVVVVVVVVMWCLVYMRCASAEYFVVTTSGKLRRFQKRAN
jgi:hypothetical protein